MGHTTSVHGGSFRTYRKKIALPERKVERLPFQVESKSNPSRNEVAILSQQLTASEAVPIKRGKY